MYNDTEYTGRFCDLADDGIRIRMNFDVAPNWSGISDGVACNWLWAYNDTNNVSQFRICHWQNGVGIVGCGPWGVDIGH